MASDNLQHSFELLKSAFEHKQEELAGAVKRLSIRLDEQQALAERPPREGSSSVDGSGNTPGARLAKADAALTIFRGTGRLKFPISGGFYNGEVKTLVDSAALGSATPGILSPQRVPGFVTGARRRLTVGMLLQRRPCGANAVDFVRETGAASVASPQGADGSSKAEATVTFSISSANVTTIAHWLPISKQALDDLPGLQDFIDRRLLYDLALKEELEVLVGDGLATHLSGLVTEASAYSGTFTAGTDTRIDTVRNAIAELETADEQPNFCVLNPADWRHMQLTKTEAGGAGTGEYLVSHPVVGGLTTPSLWGLRLIVTNSMPAGRFLVGDSAQAAIYDRLQSVVDLSESHDDFFSRNLVAIRAEQRIALAVFRPSAFLTGTF